MPFNAVLCRAGRLLPCTKCISVQAQQSIIGGFIELLVHFDCQLPTDQEEVSFAAGAYRLQVPGNPVGDNMMITKLALALFALPAALCATQNITVGSSDL